MKEAKLTEWFEDGSEPYTFKINANAFDGLNQETIRLLYSMVDEFKNVRSHVAVFEFESASYGTVYMPAGIIYDVKLETRQQLYDVNEVQCNMNVGAGVYVDNDMVV